jgi:quinoprotein glucose dehydrogenase
MTSRSAGPLTFASGVIYALLGLALAAGGAWLVLLSGSWFYLLAGLALLVTGILLARARRSALWLYAALLLATVIWAVVEVGFDWWQLLPRIDLWLVLGLYLLLPWTRSLAQRARSGRLALWCAVTAAVVVLVVGLFSNDDKLAGTLPATSMSRSGGDDAPAVAEYDWIAYGRSGYGNRYAPAKQITPANVSRLQVAWTYHTGDFKGPDDPGEIANEVTPLKANGLLYLCTPHNIVIALDPDSGKEIWRFDPKISRDARSYQHMICRGVSYYDAAHYPESTPASAGATKVDAAATNTLADETASVDPAAQETASRIAFRDTAVAACPRRIYAPTADATIVAINADDGKLCTHFGNNGVVDLKTSMGHVTPGFLNPTSPPTVTGRVLIAAASVTDNDSTDEPSGVIRGFDIDSGRLLWNFDAGNPDQTEPLPPGQTYVRNSPNSWSVASADEKLGLVYLPMGNQTPDIWGGNRIPAGTRFNSSILALEIATGKLAWVYQTVHHDIWDLDVGSQPVLVDLDRPGGKVPALIAPTKRGDLYVLDRRNGELVVPAPEKPVPQGASKGDFTAATQPFSELSFAPDRPLRESDMWGTNPFDQLACRVIFKRHRYEGVFTPSSEQGSIVYPGNYGIFNWGSVTIDPVRQIIIANPNYMAFTSRLYPHDKVDAKGGSGTEQGLQPMTGTPFAVDLRPLMSPLGFPCQAPPWGYIAAVDLGTMQKIWMHKNGTVIDNAPLPIPLPLGVPSLGGAMTTGGGVAFMSATLDYYLRAYDVSTGKKLWQARLPAGGQATPMSYVSERSGRQYVVIMAGGHGSLGTKMGDSLIAYALPSEASK